MKRDKRTWHALVMVLSGIALCIATAGLPRRAEAVVTIECEIFVQSGDGVVPGQQPVAVAGINVEEDDLLVASPYPGIPPLGGGGSTLQWIELIVATDVLDTFVGQIGDPDAWNGADLRNQLITYLDGVFNEFAVWVDGTSTLESEQGEFVFHFPQADGDDRPLIPLADLDANGTIDTAENSGAEIYENFIRGARGRIVSFARNRALGNALRAAQVYTNDWLVTENDLMRSFRDPETEELMDQIGYRFAFRWPAHGGPAETSVRINPLSQFRFPYLGWPYDNPALPGFLSLIPQHPSNQYIGPSGDGEGEEPLFSGNDYYLTFQPGLLYPLDAVTSFRILPPIPEDPVFGYPPYPPGVQSSPPPEDEFEGCEPDASYGGGGLNFIVRVDPVPLRSSPQGYAPDGVYTRIRPDVVGTGLDRSSWTYEALPQIRQMEYPTAVIAIHAHGGDPAENPIFIDRITVTLTDVGGGLMFGRSASHAGNGDFNPWFGLDDFRGPPGFRGIDVYRDTDNDGNLDPDNDLVYWSWPTFMGLGYSPWEPYFYILNPGKGVAPWYRDDPEWTIVLDMVPHILCRPPLAYVRDDEPLDPDTNQADFALEVVENADPTPDFFVAVRLDSGYTDGWDVSVEGDGTGIEYGADFRAYIKPELITDYNDPLNQLARSYGLRNFPAGILFSVQSSSIDGLGPSIESTMDEIDSPPYQAVMQTHDYVINARSNNLFQYSMWYETVPFYMGEDRPEVGGPRSPFLPVPPTFPQPNPPGTLSDLGIWYVPSDYYTAITLYEERNFFEDRIGHRVHAQRVDSPSSPTAIVGLNVVNTPDPQTLAFNDLKVARIDCYIVSEDRHGPTGFEPSDLLPPSDDGLGDTGISLWRDAADDAGDLSQEEFTGGHSSGFFANWNDIQVPLVILTIGDTPEPIEMDGIFQDRDGDNQPDPDLWGYPVALKPVTAFRVPQNDEAENDGDDLYIVIQTSDTISYKDKIEVVIPFGGVTFQPTGKSAVSGTERHDREFYEWSLWYDPPVPRLGWYSWPLPIEYGDMIHSLPFFSLASADVTRLFGTSQLLANVPTVLNPLVVPNVDTDTDGVADALAIGPDLEIPVLGLDIATLNQDAEVYLEYLVVEFYNQGADEDEDGQPDDDDFSPVVDLLPLTTDSATSGIGLYRDSDGDGEFDPDTDIPIQFDDPPDLVGVSGEPDIQVRMAFSSPGTDNIAGSIAPPWPDDDAPMDQQDNLRQLVPTTFGRDEDGDLIPGHPDAGDDFFVVIRTSDKIGLGDDFSVGIVSWGPDTPTGIDADTFTAPPAPWQPSDEYEIFDENAYGSRGIGFIELLSDQTNPVPRAFTNLSGFNFLRTRSTVQAESAVLYATTGVEEPEEPEPPPGEQTPDSPYRGGGGGGGGCFIATAAFGSPYEEHVATLVAFRDRYLLTNACGTWMVRQYYRISPPLAEFIAAHDGARTVAREAIRPLAFITRLCVASSAADMIAATCAVVLFTIVLIRTRRTRRFSTVKVHRR